jgi:uncharacterized protein YceH (UPF0502 family)
VVDYDEETVVEALRRLALRGWTRLASGPGGRARKYRHLLDRELGLDDGQIALLAVLMLRGPQTPGELKQRAARLQELTLPEVHETLDTLVAAGHVVRHERRPGQKEDRYEHLLGDEEDDEGDRVPERSAGAVTRVGDGAEEDRLARVELELTQLREEIVRLREALGD